MRKITTQFDREIYRVNTGVDNDNEMKIIKFPGQSTSVPPTSDLKLLIGPVSFSCPACGTKSEFEIVNAVFRSIEFYCNGVSGKTRCGRPYRIINPAFYVPPDGKKRS